MHPGTDFLGESLVAKQDVIQDEEYADDPGEDGRCDLAPESFGVRV